MDFISISENPFPNKGLIPSKIFIVPYRSRVQHKFFLSKYMTFLLEDEEPGSYEIYFSHQCDDRPFNRGATKNIGFLAMKKKYPADYKNMNFIFNDVDTLPFNKIFNYETVFGVVSHLYGFNFALGGIVIFKGDDFERINGYPNYWGWGMEDNVLQQRCNKHNLVIDRSNFYSIGSPEILQLFDGIKRLVVRNSHGDAKTDNGLDGLKTIYYLSYTIDSSSLNPADNEYIVDNPSIFIINITKFSTLNPADKYTFENYDLRDVRNSNNGSEMGLQMKIESKQHNPNINKYSPEYSKQIGNKERATTSVNIRMGGLFK